MSLLPRTEISTVAIESVLESAIPLMPPFTTIRFSFDAPLVALLINKPWDSIHMVISGNLSGAILSSVREIVSGPSTQLHFEHAAASGAFRFSFSVGAHSRCQRHNTLNTSLPGQGRILRKDARDHLGCERVAFDIAVWVAHGTADCAEGCGNHSIIGGGCSEGHRYVNQYRHECRADHRVK